MRICWYRFKSYCEEFFKVHPHAFVAPLRLNGSAIETVFSQLKHATGGNLTAVSYAPARVQLITKRSIHGVRVKDDYRNAPLYIREQELPSRKRPRKK